MQNILSIIVSNTTLEARWLNTLSLLETIGARKIAKSVCASGHPPVDILEHQADEARHAYAFKKLAHQLAGSAAVDYLCRDAATGYFQGLDQAVSAGLAQYAEAERGMLCYLMVTTLIEKRAMQIYPLYMSLTHNQQVKSELKTIILEESRHKKPLEAKAEQFFLRHQIPFWGPWETLEAELFAGFAQALENTLVKAA